MRFRDLIGESTAGVTRRVGRALLTSTGTVLGVGALVATVGLTATAAARIGSRFDLLKANEVVVQDSLGGTRGESTFPSNTDSLLDRLNGVVAGGQFWTVTRDAAVTSTALEEGVEFVTVQAVSPGALLAMEPQVLAGRLYSSFAQRRGESVAVIGVGLVRQLGLSESQAARSSIRVDGHLLSLVAVVDDIKRNPVMISGLAIPTSTAGGMWGNIGAASSQVLIHARLGAAQLIARQAPTALLPSDPDRLIAIAPPTPETLRVGVESDVNGLFVILALVSLAVGGLSIANTTLISVLERISEIGLRRSLGASRRAVAGQFLLESAMLGGLGGVFGTALGVIIVVTVSALRGWTPVMDSYVWLVGLALGVGTGFLAGVYPSMKAARVEPIDALRR